jgi:hypothetical protein
VDDSRRLTYLVTSSGDEISKLMQFLNSQPQLIVCGRLGMQPLADARRRELLSSVDLFDALETVALLQSRLTFPSSRSNVR